MSDINVGEAFGEDLGVRFYLHLEKHGFARDSLHGFVHQCT